MGFGGLTEKPLLHWNLSYFGERKDLKLLSPMPGRFSSMPAGTSVSTMTPVEAAAFGSQLRAMGAVLFGASNDNGFTARAKADLEPLILSGDVMYVACDAGAAEAAACARANVAMTPTFAMGTERVEGYSGLRSYALLADAPAYIAAILSARGARFYGRDGCVWTRRQKAVLGVHATSLYIDCDESGAAGGAEKCKTANISAVPAWSVPGISPSPEPGFRTLAALREWIA